MRLRKLIATAFVAVCAFAICACTGESRLEKLVNKINEGCPVTADIGEVTSAEVKDGNVVVKMTVNEQFCNIEGLKANPDILHQSLIESFMHPTDDMKELVEELKRCNAGLTYVYVGNTTGNTTSVTLTNEEIKELAKKGPADIDADQLLESQINITNIHMPITVDDATVMTKLVREDDCVVYLYDVDETQISITELEASSESVVMMLTASLQQSKDEPANKGFIHACKMADVDIAFRYHGTTTGEEATFVVPIDNI